MGALKDVPILVQFAPPDALRAKEPLDHAAPALEILYVLLGGCHRAVGQRISGPRLGPAHRVHDKVVVDPEDLAGVLVLPWVSAVLALAGQIDRIGTGHAAFHGEGAMRAP